MSFISTNENALVSGSPSFSCLISAWLLDDEYLSSYLRSNSVGNIYL